MRSVFSVLQALTDAGIGYVVVGGVAVVLQGHPRMTIDLDVVLDLGRDDNVRAAVEVLTGLGLTPRLPVAAADFADDDLQQRARRVEIDGVQVPVASIDDLITMKSEAGRPQDLADIEALRAIARDREAGS